MVLVASLTIPAKAVNNVLYVWDYLSDYYEENGVLNYSFSFQDIPSYYTLVDDTGDFAEGYPPLSLSSTPAQTWVQVHAWPLGVRNWPGVSCSGGVIAVSDFNRFVTVDLSCTGSLFFLYSGTTSGKSYQFQIKSYWQMLYYDADGNYLGNDISETVEKNVVYDAPVTDVDVHAFGASMDLEMPEETAYFCPLLKTQLYFHSQGSDFVYKVGSSFDGFTIGCAASSVMQNTETLMRIEEQMDELNDKADTLINGTPEMNQDALDAAGFAQDQQEEANRIEELEKEYLDDFEQSSHVLNDQVTDFVDGTGFNQLTALVTPVVNWEHSSLLFMMVIAFINMSVILFGR